MQEVEGLSPPNDCVYSDASRERILNPLTENTASSSDVICIYHVLTGHLLISVADHQAIHP
jgi:hypothetical protein